MLDEALHGAVAATKATTKAQASSYGKYGPVGVSCIPPFGSGADLLLPIAMREQLSTERESAQRLRVDVMEPVRARRVREAESLL